MDEVEYAVDGGGYRWYEIEPVQHGLTDEAAEWWECPLCGEALDYNAAHDRYTEGFAPEATPDVWRCAECGYNHVS